MPEPSAFPAAAQVAEIERRIQWRALPSLVFLGILVGLTAVAMHAVFTPSRAIEGLPDDPDVRAAQAIASTRLAFPTGGLRFHSQLTGDVPRAPGEAPHPDPAATSEVRALLERARARHPRDLRIRVALAHVDLSRHAFETAARGYRAVIDRGDRCGEAHMGLGVALARQASLEPDPLEARALALRAIAQFAAVRPDDPGHSAALYDRALLLADVGRTAEARRMADAFGRQDADGAWARSLAGALTGR